MNHGRTPAMYTRELEARVAELKARNSELERWQAVVNAGNWSETTTIHKLNRQIKEQAERIAELEEANKLVIERRDELYAENKKHIERVTQLEVENVALKLANKAEKSDRARLSERVAELETVKFNVECEATAHWKDSMARADLAIRLSEENARLREALEKILDYENADGIKPRDGLAHPFDVAKAALTRQITKIDGATSNADAQSTPKVTTTSELTSKPEGSGSSCNLPPSTTPVQGVRPCPTHGMNSYAPGCPGCMSGPYKTISSKLPKQQLSENGGACGSTVGALCGENIAPVQTTAQDSYRGTRCKDNYHTFGTNKRCQCGAQSGEDTNG